MKNCTFTEPDYRCFEMSSPPVVIKGLLDIPIILFDNIIKIGDRAMERKAAPKLLEVLGSYSHQLEQNRKAA